MRSCPDCNGNGELTKTMVIVPVESVNHVALVDVEYENVSYVCKSCGCEWDTLDTLDANLARARAIAKKKKAISPIDPVAWGKLMNDMFNWWLKKTLKKTL